MAWAGSRLRLPSPTAVLRPCRRSPPCRRIATPRSRRKARARAVAPVPPCRVVEPPWGSRARSSWTSSPTPSRPPPSSSRSLPAERQHKEGERKAGPPTGPLPKSQVLGKVKDFLGEMAKANEKLQLDAQNKPYDIEALTGNEKEYIEMDLLLGVADLHSEQAVDAAEATMSGFPPAGKSFASSSSDSEDDSDEDGGDEPDMSSKDKCKDPDESETHPAKGKKPNKRQKIVVLN